MLLFAVERIVGEDNVLGVMILLRLVVAGTNGIADGMWLNLQHNDISIVLSNRLSTIQAEPFGFCR